LRDTRNNSKAEWTDSGQRERVGLEVRHLSYTAAGSLQPSSSITTRHLTSSRTTAAASLLSLRPETPHTTLRRPVRRGPRLLLCLSAELLRPADRVASYRPNTLSLSLACCSEAYRDRATSLPPSRPPALISPNLSVPSATCRGSLLLCARIPRSPFLHWVITTRRAWKWLV